MKKSKGRGKRTMWIALLVTVSIIVLVAGMVAVGFSIVRREYPDRKEILPAISADAQKALIVYQPSITPAASDVAHAIAQGLNDAGYEVTLNTPGVHMSADLGGYALVVFGSPNYGGSPGQPLLDYLKRIDSFDNKRILLFSTSGSAEGKLEFEKMEALLKGTQPEKTMKLKASDHERNKEAAYAFGLDAGQ